jgi:hypothetical protein
MSNQTQSCQSTAEFVTPKASGYLQQLCKHFGHKIPATFDETSGHLTFGCGECHLTAEAGKLRMTLNSADAAQLAQLQDIILRHLQRFAFREAPVIAWQDA